MTLQLKDEILDSPVLERLIHLFSETADFQVNPEVVTAAVNTFLNTYHDLLQSKDAFIEEMSSLDFEMLSFSNEGEQDAFDVYLELQKFLYLVRREILERHYHTQEQEIRLNKQRRIPSPSLEAYDDMGNNQTEIGFTPNSFRIYHT